MRRKMMSGFIVVLTLVFAASFAGAEQLSPELCKAKAKAAAALLQSEGESALSTIKDPDGAFRFAEGEGYIWIHNLDGVMVMHPIKSALDGKGLLDMRDVNGTYLFVAMNELCEESGEGWVPYSWPKPGEEKSSPKVSYVVLAEHGGKNYVAGSGMYDVTVEDIKTKFPNDAVYEDE
jgi:methyl-accepting chemotaxis protein